MIFILFTTLLFSQNITKVLTNFQDVTLRDFSYTDSFGSSFDKNIQYGTLELKYDVKPGGYAGWGVILEEKDISQYEKLVIRYKGKLETLGVKDSSGKEKKISIPKADDWTEIEIPLVQFKEINLGSVENINFSFTKGKGSVYIDYISVESSYREKTIYIDDFNRPNSYLNYYQRISGDARGLLDTSRKSKEGDYSLRINYYAKTDSLGNNYFEVFWKGERTLNWEDVKKLRFWVKGDGSDSYIKFRVEDKDGEIWEVENTEILGSFTWEEWEIDIDDFKLSGKRKNGKFDKKNIRAYSWIIGNKNVRSKEYAEGDVYIDSFEAEGLELKGDEVSPFIIKKYIYTSPVNWKGEINNQYFWSPEEKGKISHYLNLKLDVTLHRNWYLESEIATEAQNFGESNAWDGEFLQTSSPGIYSPKITVSGKDVTDFLEEINIGNLWIDYGDYLFYPRWGFKGIQFLGKLNNFLRWDYFYIKRIYNSFSQGARAEFYYRSYKLSLKAVQNRDTAKYAFSSDEWKIGDVLNDIGYVFSLEKRFFEDNTQILFLKADVGENISKEFATKDTSDIYHPVYNLELDSPTVRDNLYKFYLSYTPFEEINLNFYWRQIGKNFTPKWRWDPKYFKDVLGDQKGYNTSIKYTIFNTDLFYEYDWIRRMSDISGYRKINKVEISYIGIPYFNISYSKEWKEDVNKTLSKNEKDEISRIFIRKDFRNLYFTSSFERQNIIWLKDNSKYTTDILELEARYYFTPAIFLEGKYVKTRYGKKEWEEIGYPFSDNYFRLNLYFRF